MEKYVDIKNLKINYITEGKGQPVLVLHGWGANIETIMPIVNILKNTMKVYAIDLPGFGKSDIPIDPIGSFDYAEIVKGFIDKMEIGSISLVGHSYGGKLSIILSANHPEMIIKQVLIDSSGLIPKRSLEYHLRVKSFKILKLIYKALFFWKDEKEKMGKLYKRFGSDDYQNTSGIMRKVFVRVVNEDLKPLLQDIKAPTLLVWGDKDDATPLYMGEIMEKEIEGSGLVVLKGAGHYSYLDEYYTFKKVLEAFFV